VSKKGRKAKGRDPRVPDARGRTSRTGPRRGLTIAVVVVVLVGLVATGGTLGYGLLQDKREADQREAVSVVDTVTIETTKGTIVLEIFPKLMPITVANFEKLADAGFYDGLVWHRVENWVVQTGDPTGTGSGGSSQRIKLETSAELSNVRGAVGMARSPEDRNSATSQFYILKADARSLDGDYAVFGKVTQGMDVVDKLTTTDKMTKVTVTRAESGTK